MKLPRGAELGIEGSEAGFAFPQEEGKTRLSSDLLLEVHISYIFILSYYIIVMSLQTLAVSAGNTCILLDY